jgi:hypothetical protein
LNKEKGIPFVKNKPRPNWPFLFYQERGKMYRNPVQKPEPIKHEDALM